MNIGAGRMVRVCDLCGGVDDHPRHVLAGGLTDRWPAPSDETVAKVLDAAPKQERARLLRELMDTSSSDRHMDCCRAAGCPDRSCDEVPDLRGADLLDHLVGGA